MLKKIILFISYISGLNNFFYYLNRKKQLILTYHNIIPDNLYDKSLHLLVSYKESLFKKHIKHIKKRFKISTNLGEPNTCMITFDDGYQNNYLIAHKILKQENVKAVFFIPVRNKLLWIDKILLWLSYVPTGEYYLFGEVIKINNYLSRENVLIKIWEILLKNYDTNYIFEQLEKCYNFSKIKISNEMMKLRFTALTKEQIDEMKKFGHIIGCHSTNHDILSMLNQEELENEIMICEKEINKLYNSNFFSYPFGTEKEVSNVVINRFKQSKFKACFMNINYPSFNYNTYAIPRMMLMPEEENIYQIDSMLSGLRYFFKYRKLFPNIS